ncbi:MAG: hypothetical protein JWP89_2647 [Schlesneria sp.]|nr:hypothetical protein [Schlesneria sp.]
MSEKIYKAGDKIETIHGEQLVVLAVEQTETVTKKGVVIQKPNTWIVAESGGHLTKFPLNKIK